MPSTVEDITVLDELKLVVERKKLAFIDYNLKIWHHICFIYNISFQEQQAFIFFIKG